MFNATFGDHLVLVGFTAGHGLVVNTTSCHRFCRLFPALGIMDLNKRPHVTINY